jgi:hypothetical protein
LISFFDLEVLKKKPIKSKGIMPHLKLSKNYFWDNVFENKINYNSYGFMKISNQILTIQKSLTIKQLRF